MSKTRHLKKVGELSTMVEIAIRAADWEPGDAQRALQQLRDDYDRASRRWRTED